MRSIRANLVLWLAAALALGTVALLAATYFFARAQLDRVFDEELRQVARAVHLREDWREQGTIRVAREDFVYAVRAYDESMAKVYDFPIPQVTLSQDPAVLARGEHLTKSLGGCAPTPRSSARCSLRSRVLARPPTAFGHRRPGSTGI